MQEFNEINFYSPFRKTTLSISVFQCLLKTPSRPASVKSILVNSFGCDILGTAARTLAPLTNFPRAAASRMTSFQDFPILALGYRSLVVPITLAKSWVDLQSVSWILAEFYFNRGLQRLYTRTCIILQKTINGFLCLLIVFS